MLAMQRAIPPPDSRSFFTPRNAAITYSSCLLADALPAQILDRILTTHFWECDGGEGINAAALLLQFSALVVCAVAISPSHLFIITAIAWPGALALRTHRPCWHSLSAPPATRGGFPCTRVLLPGLRSRVICQGDFRLWAGFKRGRCTCPEA